MSEDRIKMRWIRYVIRGEGKARSDSNERYSYRGPILYSNEHPVARLVKLGKDWICVTKSGVRPRSPSDWTADGHFKPVLKGTINAPCIGVFSYYDGDMVDDAKLHERVKWLYHCEAQSLVEKAEVWPADKLLLKAKWRHGIGADQLRSEMQYILKHFANYSAEFNLGWSPFPTHYVDDLNRAIKRRGDDYFDPKTVVQRERQLARKQAKEALGV